MTTRDFEAYLVSLFGPMGGGDGLAFGDPLAEVKAVQICWMANVEAIRHAVSVGANMILAHEAVFFPYPGIRSGVAPADSLSWPVNRERIRLMSDAGVSVIRVHSPMDRWHGGEAFRQALGLPQRSLAEADGLKVYDVEPVPLGRFVEDVKRRLGLATVRVGRAPMDRVVRRVALAPGGTGLFVNAEYQARLLKWKPDVIVGGETDTYGIHFALDVGVPFVETGHEVSENADTRRVADRIRQDLPGLPVHWFENARPWVVV